MISVTCASWKRVIGTGGMRDLIGRVNNKDECVGLCLKNSQNCVHANGAEFDVFSEEVWCFCRYGQTGQREHNRWMNTYIRPCEIISLYPLWYG